MLEIILISFVLVVALQSYFLYQNHKDLVKHLPEKQELKVPFPQNYDKVESIIKDPDLVPLEDIEDDQLKDAIQKEFSEEDKEAKEAKVEAGV